MTDDWRDISTAPKDGTPLLLYYPEGEIEWTEDSDVVCKPMMAVMACEEGGYWKGYYEAIGPNGEPTHWRFLPGLPPTEKAG